IDACGFVFAASPKRRPQVAAARHRARLDASFWWCARTYAGSRCRLLCCGHAASGDIRSDYCLSASQRLYHLHQHRRFNNPALLRPGAVIRLSTLATSTTSISTTAASDATVAYAISALAQGSASPVSVVNSGNILVITTGVMGAVNGYGINGETVGAGSPGSIVNSGQISVSSTRTAIGISGGGGSAVSIVSGLGGALRFRGRHPPKPY